MFPHSTAEGAGEMVSGSILLLQEQWDATLASVKGPCHCKSDSSLQFKECDWLVGLKSSICLWSFRKAEFQKLELTACGKLCCHLLFTCHGLGSSRTGRVVRRVTPWPVPIHLFMESSPSFFRGIKTFLKLNISQSFQT